ncbi:hypothetical protein ABFX02_01G073500 [Erythranthe guttata]
MKIIGSVESRTMSSPGRSPNRDTISNLSEFLPEILVSIAKLCTSIHDYISFRGVCRSFRSAATLENFDREWTGRLPWLMLVSRGRIKEEESKEILDRNYTRVADLVDLFEKKTYKIANFPPLDRSMYPSSKGWILCSSSADIYLTHPVWRIRIYLPGLETFPPETDESPISISKIVLSDSPAVKTDLLVMVIWGEKNQLGFCRPGDDSWTVMDSSEVPFCDIIYHKRKLYAVDSESRVVECDVHGKNPVQLRQVFSMPPARDDVDPSPPHGTYYLVESLGEILIVDRQTYSVETVLFKVYGFDLMDGCTDRRKEIRDLGNRALFVGSNSSFSVDLSKRDGVKRSNGVKRSHSSLPVAFSSQLDDVKPNCIYFTDHSVRTNGLDNGVFCLSDMKTERYIVRCDICAFPTWVLPSF